MVGSFTIDFGTPPTDLFMGSGTRANPYYLMHICPPWVPGKCDPGTAGLTLETRHSTKGGQKLDLPHEVITIVGQVLNLGKRSLAFGTDTQLLGSVPELDSMAVATLITALEEHFGFVVDDDEIDGATFATIGSLVDFVRGKQAA